MIETHPITDIPTDINTQKLHIVRRVGDESSTRFERNALCGVKMKKLVLEHTGDICQQCVDIQRRE